MEIFIWIHTHPSYLELQLFFCSSEQLVNVPTMSTAGLAETGVPSLANGPIDLEASEVTRSSSRASSRHRSIVEPDTASASGKGSTKKDKENLERLLNIFNGGNGLDFGVSFLEVIIASDKMLSAEKY